MKSTVDLIRIWAVITGLALAAWYFGATYVGVKLTGILPMLISAIGGFELWFVGHDFWMKRRRHNG